MRKITPFLWFKDNAQEAIDFYVSIFSKAESKKSTHYTEESAEASGQPEGTIMTSEFQLEGQDFVALNGGPIFKFTPAISFFVSCQEPDEIEKLWERLSHGGKVLMELDKYPFSERYGWLEDKFGVSWQLNFADAEQKIKPALMFTGDQFGKVEEAMKFYTALFEGSGIDKIERYTAGENDKEGAIKYAEFTLSGKNFVAMESSMEHAFTFTPAISFVVDCQAQEDVDKFWEKLSEGGEKGQCGWLEDKFGISWQIVPAALGEMMSDPDKEKSRRVMKAMLEMTKLDIEKLKQAYEE
ncbi:MAG: 3-demethylubiquinone-9 3-methyltransferase [Candidatus Moranbacteria bacterium GW2011_GWC2_37_8]|nr:MAG: 3-demethylubiquinone-9 3-methyltransferase [Candidatus Moranbacteria bacterium GW2011_GWC2_37_8]KKQ62859.1 MAG: hypothetical protein US82_C0005G0032 [Parcubacteria group bacterium GW2011_GWC1_38_22]